MDMLITSFARSRLAVEIVEQILPHCDMPSLAVLYRDKYFRPVVCNELSASIAHTLSSITPDPAQFQSMMRTTRSIISGSTALHHVLRWPTAWKPGDVDLLVPNHRFVEAVHFILAIQGATIVNEHHEEYEGYATGFVHIVQVQTPLAKFDIVQSPDRSPFRPIAHYYGTHVMNAITSDLVICAYPSMTFEGHSFVTPRRHQQILNPSTVRAIEKYTQRGFKFINRDPQPSHFGQACSTCITCPIRNRAFGDQYCLITPNTHTPVQTVLQFMDEFSTTAWKLGGKPCGNPSCYIQGYHTVTTTTWGEVKRLSDAQ